MLQGLQRLPRRNPADKPCPSPKEMALCAAMVGSIRVAKRTGYRMEKREDTEI